MASFEKILAMLFLSALLIAQPIYTVSGKEIEEEIGTDGYGIISDSIRELIEQHRQSISTFILDRRLHLSRADEQRLSLLEEHAQKTQQTIEFVESKRLELVNSLKNGEISASEFILEMRRLGSYVSFMMKISERLGHSMGAVGKELSANLSETAKEMVELNRLYMELLREIKRELKENVEIGKHLKMNITKDCKKLSLLEELLNKTIARLEDRKRDLTDRARELRERITEIEVRMRNTTKPGECLEMLNNMTSRLSRLMSELHELVKKKKEIGKEILTTEEEISHLKDVEARMRKWISEPDSASSRLEGERKGTEKNFDERETRGRVGRGSEKEKGQERLLDSVGESERLREMRKKELEVLDRSIEKIKEARERLERLKINLSNIVEEIARKMRDRDELSRMLEQLREKCGKGLDESFKLQRQKYVLEKKLKMTEIQMAMIDQKLRFFSEILNEVKARIETSCATTRQDAQT